MGFTGLIYAAIVVAWAAYLVPLALRRHDEAAHGRSIERFSSAMRVLSWRGIGSSRQQGAQERSVSASSREVDRVLSPSLKPRSTDRLGVEAAARPSRTAQRAAAARRRRVLTVLVVALVAVGVAWAFGLVMWWSSAIPVALIVVFLVVARRQVRKAEEAFWVSASQQRREPSNVVRRSAIRVDASGGAAKPGSAADVDPDDEPTVTLSAEQIAAAVPGLTEERVGVVSMTTSDGDSLWDPLPITLPTYVDKPAAKRTIRTIELGEPGTWSAGHNEDDSRAAAAAASVTTGSSTAVDEERRAVNG